MTEELAFKQSFWECATIDHDERLISPGTEHVNRFCQEFFSRSALPMNEDRRRAVRDKSGHVEELLHDRTSADQIAETICGRYGRGVGR